MTLRCYERARSSKTEELRIERAFTLLEMLVVMAIIVILIALVSPAVSTIARGSQLTQSSDKLVAILTLAQQAATARNQSVEVRFFQYGDLSVPGESATNAASGKFRALQLYLINDNGTATPFDRVETFSGGIIADSGTNISTLLTSTQRKTWTVTDPQVPLPRAGNFYNCYAFRYRPDGSTSLLATDNWFITLHSIIDGDARTAPPSNYATIQVDPIGGAISVYRP